MHRKHVAINVSNTILANLALAYTLLSFYETRRRQAGPGLILSTRPVGHGDAGLIPTHSRPFEGDLSCVPCPQCLD